MPEPAVVVSITADDVEQLAFRGMPKRKRTFSLRSKDLVTDQALEPMQWVHGTFRGRVVGIHFDENVTKKDEEGNPIAVPEWRRKNVVEVIAVEFD